MANTPLKTVIIEIPTDKIWPNPEQPRKESWGDIEGLKITMSGRGLVQYPIVIRKDQPKAKGRFMIISGERRWRAAKMGGIKKMFCIWRKDINEKDIFVLSVMENLQRQPLNPMEEARAYSRLLKEFHGISVADLAKKLGVSQPKIYNALKLLELPAEIQAQVAQRRISPVSVAGLHSIPDAKTKIKIAKKIVDKKLTGRQAQTLILDEMSKKGANLSDGRSARDVKFVKNFDCFAKAVASLSGLFDYWTKLTNQDRKEFLEAVQGNKMLLRDLHYARTLVNQIGEHSD